MPAAAGPVPTSIANAWPQTPGDHPVVVGFSGGLDSTVLLHSLVAHLGATRVIAAHVHHGLHAAADQWLADARRMADRLQCRFDAAHLSRPTGNPSGGIEQWARDGRRRALMAVCQKHQAGQLALAHHADDQIETLLLNWGRGAGPAGMRGMSARATLGQIELLRPLLALERTELLAYAQANKLTWVEDSSNTELVYRRNRLRHQVLPLLTDIFPGFKQNVLRHAEIVREQTGADSGADPQAPRPHQIPQGTGFDRRAYLSLTDPQLDQLLHDWLRHLKRQAPSRARTTHIREHLLRSPATYAEIQHDGHVLRRYRDRVVLTEELPAPPVNEPLGWAGQGSLWQPGYGGELTFTAADADQAGLPARLVKAASVRIGPLRMSARIRLRAAGPRRTLKQICQERGIPNWVRPYVPMLSSGDQVLYVAGVGMNADLTEPGDDAGRGERVVVAFNRSDATAGFDWPL